MALRMMAGFIKKTTLGGSNVFAEARSSILNWRKLAKKNRAISHHRPSSPGQGKSFPGRGCGGGGTKTLLISRCRLRPATSFFRQLENSFPSITCDCRIRKMERERGLLRAATAADFGLSEKPVALGRGGPSSHAFRRRTPFRAHGSAATGLRKR